MNRAEPLIVAGLNGQTGPADPGHRFAFVSYNCESEARVDVLAEEPTPFLALMRGVDRLWSDYLESFFLNQYESDDPTEWAFFDTLPEEIRNSGNIALIGFLLYAAENQAFLHRGYSWYLDDRIAEILPGAGCEFAWDAAPPRQEEAFGLYAFHPVPFSPHWGTDTARALARQMHESGDFGAMPILADALEDAGCDNKDILNHCREPGEHVRGRWVVDLVRGK
jgi:hypothetical protein